MNTTRYTIIGDSLIKYIEGWTTEKENTELKVTTQSFSGCTCLRLLHKIINKKIKIEENIIILIGTNDIESTPRSEIQGKIASIIDTLKEIPKVHKVMILGLLPRPKDHNKTWEKICLLSEWLARKENQDQGKYYFWKTHKAFINKRRYRETPTVKNELFARDGLHLSTLGTERLRQQIKMAISVIEK